MSDVNTASSSTISFSILDTLQEAQNQHGLRHHDYESYRRYCSHKLARLAHRLRVSLKIRKTHSSASQKLVIAMLPHEPLDISRLQYFLFELERDWALTHSLKQKGSEHNSRVSAHIRKRAKKLLARSQAFLSPFTSSDVKPSGLTDKLWLEILAYAHHMIGYACMLLKDWTRSLTALDASLQYYAFFPHHAIDEVKSVFKYVQHQSTGKEAAALRSSEEKQALTSALSHFSLTLRRSDLRIEWAGKSILVADPVLAQQLELVSHGTDFTTLLKSTSQMPDLHSYVLFESQAKKVNALLQAAEKTGSYEKYLQGGLNARRRTHFRWTRSGHAKKIIKVLEAMKNDSILKENLSLTKALENRVLLFSIERAILQALHLKKKEALTLLSNVKDRLAAAKKESELLSSALKALKQSELERDKWETLMHVIVQLIAMLSGQAPNTITRTSKKLTKKSNRSKAKGPISSSSPAPSSTTTSTSASAAAPKAVFYDAHTHDIQVDSEDEEEHEHDAVSQVYPNTQSPTAPSSTSSISGLLKRWWSGSQ